MEQKLLLALNIGNTHVSAGVFDFLEKVPAPPENKSPIFELIHTTRFKTHPIPKSAALKELFTSEFSLFPITTVAVASVVPAFTEILHEVEQSSETGFLSDFYFIDHLAPFSFVNETDFPEKVGKDRLVNAEAAVRLYGAPCIIVDVGTATTFSVIGASNGKPRFLGGAFTPGIRTSMNAIVENTAQLLSVELAPPPTAIGKNTQDALQSGILLGHASLIDGMAYRFELELFSEELRGEELCGSALGTSRGGNLSSTCLHLDHKRLPIIATGGLGSLIAPLCKKITEVQPHLTLKGIAYTYDTFRKQ